MKRAMLLLVITISAGWASAQTNPVTSTKSDTHHIIYKPDTILYDAPKYKVTLNSTVLALLKEMEGFEVGSDSSVTHIGQSIMKLNINGKYYVGLDMAKAIAKLPADAVERIEVIDDYGDSAAFTSIKSGDPKKVLNIVIKTNSMPDVKQLLCLVNATIIRMDCRDVISADIREILNQIPNTSTATVDDYGDQIPHFLIVPPAYVSRVSL